MIRIKSPKKYPIYSRLVKAGIKPGLARRMIERAINNPSANVHEPKGWHSPASFCIWCETGSHRELWRKASGHFGEEFYA